MKKKEQNRDITERIKSLEALKASERRFESLFEGAAEGILVADADTGIFYFANRSVCEMFGYPAGGMTGLSIGDIHPTGELHWAMTAFNEMKNGMINRIVDLACLRKDGSVFYADVRGSRMETEGIDCMAGFFTDTTARRAAELALKERMERYELVIRGSGAALWDWDVAEKRIMFSPRWKEMRGYGEGELGDSEEEWIAGIHPEDLPRVKAAVEAHFRGESVHFSEEYRVRRKDGSWFWIHDRGLALRDGAGDVVRMAGLETDITERKRAEERMERENREVALMNRILRAFTETVGNELFDQVLQIAMEGLASTHGVFGYIAEPGHLICPSLTKMLDECEVEGKCIHYPPEKWKGMWARALTEKRPIYSNLPSPVPPGHPDIRNNLASPVLYRGEAIGLLNLANREGGYTDADQGLLVAMADRIAPLLYAWIQKKLREDERTAAEEALRDKEAELQLVADTTPIVLARLSRDLRYKFVNRACCEMYGRPREEIVGKHITEIMGKEAFEVIRPYVEKVLQGESVKYELEIPYRDIGRRFKQVAYKPEKNDRGEVVGWVASVLDITEQKRSVEALRDSEELNRRTLQALPAHIAVLDSSGRIIAVNQAWTEFAAGNEAAGSPAVEVGADYLETCRRAASARDDFAAMAMAGIESVMNGAQPQFITEYPCHSPREQRWFLMTVVPLGNGGAVITHLNITNRKSAEESLTKFMGDLKEANDELTRFNKAMVGRELRMIELKKEVNDLCARIGQPPPYMMSEDA